MGAASSTPAPFVNVNLHGGGPMLIPADQTHLPPTPFGPTYHPISPPRVKRRKRPSYPFNPHATQLHTTTHPRHRGGARTHPGRHANAGLHTQSGGFGIGGGEFRGEFESREGSEDSESTLEGMGPPMGGPGGGGGFPGRGGGYPGGAGMIGGGRMMGSGGMKGGRRGYLDENGRSQFTPEIMRRMGMGGMPGMGNMGMGDPRGMMGGMGGQMPPGMGGGMGGGMPPGMGNMSMPPAYTPNPPLHTGMNPYTHPPNYPNHPLSPPSSSAHSSPPAQKRRPSARASGGHERIPMGAYTGGEKTRKSSRGHTPTSAKLNRGQPTDRRVGPSGMEYLEGDSFLDKCTCTTGCKCRKGHRVIYLERRDRSRDRDGDDGDDDGGPVYLSGEIRYILKDDLGRNCDDHSACKKESSSSESEKDAQRKEKADKKNKKKAEKNIKQDEKDQKQQFEEFKDEMMGALGDGFEDMKRHQQQRSGLGRMPQSPFVGPEMGGPNPFMMDEAGMDPRLAQQMGRAMGANPYAMGMPNMQPQGMGQMPPGMPEAMGNRGMRPSRMPMGGGMGTGMGYEGDISMMDMEGMGMDMGMGARNPYAQPGMMSKKGLRPGFVSPRGAKGPGRFGHADMDMDDMGLFGRDPTMRGGRGGMMGSRGLASGGRRLYPGSESEELDKGHPRRSAMGPGRRGDSENSFGRMPAGASVRGDDAKGGLFSARRGLNASPNTRNAARGALNRGKQARVEDEDSSANDREGF